MSQEPTAIPEPQPSSLDLLFQKDPLDLTEEDLTEIISALRRARALWAQAEAEAKLTGKKPKAAKGPQPQVDIKDLELDL